MKIAGQKALWVPSWLLALAVALLLVNHLEGSQFPRLFIYSWSKFLFLGGLCLLVAYFGVGPFYSRLRKINAALFYALLAGFLVLEILLRLFPGRIPMDCIILLPGEGRRQAARARGLFTQETLQGEGLLYAYLPKFAEPIHPWQVIDEWGYRNPAPPERSVDLVLLGDSMLVARHVPRDLGSLFRAEGLSVVNLGFGGYGPGQYRDTYRKYIKECGYKPRWVVIHVCLDNDFLDARRYAETEKAGGDWREYLGQVDFPDLPEWFERSWMPWTVAAVWRSPHWLYRRMRIYREDQGDRIQVALSRGTLNIPAFLFTYRHYGRRSPEWSHLRAYLDETIQMARESGARIALILMPVTGALYAPYVTEEGPDQIRMLEAFQQTRERFQQYFSAPDTMVIDGTGPLQEAIDQRPITLHKTDFHLNQAGVQVVYEVLRKHMLARGP